MYGEFEKGNSALSLIDATNLHVGLNFDWLGYPQVGRGSQICGLEKTDTVGGSIVTVSGAQY